MDQAENLRNIIKKQNQRDVGNARVIAVTSGKGGVGKSLVTASLANLMKEQGYSVGILDADILRKPCIQRIGKLLRRHPCLGVKNCDIAQCMHTGIGTAGSDHLCLSSEKF